MIACVSSSFLCYEETINTLKYAQQARKIKNTARWNIDEKSSKVAAKLKSEIVLLRKELASIKTELNHIEQDNIKKEEEKLKQ